MLTGDCFFFTTLNFCFLTFGCDYLTACQPCVIMKLWGNTSIRLGKFRLWLVVRPSVYSGGTVDLFHPCRCIELVGRAREHLCLLLPVSVRLTHAQNKGILYTLNWELNIANFDANLVSVGDGHTLNFTHVWPYPKSLKHTLFLFPRLSMCSTFLLLLIPLTPAHHTFHSQRFFRHRRLICYLLCFWSVNVIISTTLVALLYLLQSIKQVCCHIYISICFDKCVSVAMCMQLWWVQLQNFI